MKSSIEIEGHLLDFDTKYADGSIISKSCDIVIPKIVPIITEFDFSDPNSIIGHAEVKRNENGLDFTGVINGEERIILPLIAMPIKGIGGYYTNVHRDGDIVTKCRLACVSVTSYPMAPNFVWKEIG